VVGEEVLRRIEAGDGRANGGEVVTGGMYLLGFSSEAQDELW